MSLDNQQAGLRHTNCVRVDERLIVPAVAPAFTGFSDMPPVFATAFLGSPLSCASAAHPPLQSTISITISNTHATRCIATGEQPFAWPS